MKTRIAVWALSVGGLSILAVMLLSDLNYYPTDQQRSAFFMSYNPSRTIAPFVDKNQSQQTGSGASAGAGTRFVTHASEFEEFFTTQKQNEHAIMAAVEDDLNAQLHLRGLRILGRQESADNALQISYAVGPILGLVVVHPLAQDLNVHRASNTLQVGAEDVILHIAIEEKWFPHGIPEQHEVAQNVR